MIELGVAPLVIIAVIRDVQSHRIPNILILAGAAVGFLLQGWAAGAGGVLAATYGLLVGLAILLPGYLMGFTGAGDAKLMAAVGTFLGPIGVLQAALISIFIGGLIAMGFAFSALIFRRSATPWGRYSLMLRALVITGRPLYIPPEEGEVMGKKFPFAVSIALGSTAWIVWQWPLA
ncbi:prepilin peptidase [Billgrantia tianxiuensis]|jgi:prepilin peptidase CpaA|uniref:Prepilin peptidase n=1 Tax=Billgrantia tianxiuensis TaxID=2497861 RepID=A0A6I6SJY9_9GAMM|nr:MULTISPECIES: prepilin peptidase [Halomonas]MCE8032456.1 prepilin peptidase [Halomonas sp. MCCC 1A11057]QHC49581.1 prepilin peptidase [Halomonas tianxiuensis]